MLERELTTDAEWGEKRQINVQETPVSQVSRHLHAT